MEKQMKERILTTVITYLQINREVLDEEKIKDLEEQIVAMVTDIYMW